jgi:hypothetical protein
MIEPGALRLTAAQSALEASELTSFVPNGLEYHQIRPWFTFWIILFRCSVRCPETFSELERQQVVL